MEGNSNTVILHTYQQQPQLLPSIVSPSLTDGYGISTPLSQADYSGSSSFVNSNPWTTASTFPNYTSDSQFTNEVSILHYPNVYDDFSKESNTGTLSDPSLHGSNSSSSTSDVGSSVDCSISPEPILMPSVKRGRPTENPCWAYFHRIDDQLVKCRLCTKVVRSACATNMTKHLERHHTEDFQKVTGQLKLFRMNDVGVRSKMQYQVAETSLSSLPVISDAAYILPKMEPMEGFDSSQYYGIQQEPTTNQPQFNQFESTQGFADPQAWPLTHLWPNTAHTNMISHLIEPSTSIGASVIQEVHKLNMNPDDKNMQHNLEHQRTLLIDQKVEEKPRIVKPASKPYQKRNRKTEHPVWTFFRRTPDGNAECIICHGVVKSPCSSNFMRHLMRHHSTEYNDVYLKWIEKRNITHPGIHCTSVPPPTSVHNDISKTDKGFSC